MRMTTNATVGTTAEFVPQFSTDTSGFGEREEDWVTLRAPRDYDTYGDARAWADEMGPDGHKVRVVKVTTVVEVVEP